MGYSDAGRPMQRNVVATPRIDKVTFESETRQLSIRNTGVNTLWFTFIDPTGGTPPVWFDIACGTSWDDRVVVKAFWFCTQTGTTSFVATGIQLNPVG